MNSDKLLIKQFLIDWIDWVNAGAKDAHYLFNRSDGLCALLNKWMREKCYRNDRVSAVSHSFYCALDREHIPFNRGNFSRQDMPYFSVEKMNGTMHTNHLRLKWVREYIKQ